MMTADMPGTWDNKDSDSGSSGIGTAEITESNSSELEDERDQTFLSASLSPYLHQQLGRSYSTGSEHSWDGTGSTSSNDHYNTSLSSSPNSSPVKDKVRLSYSYDSSVSKILEFHRSLAAYYNHGPQRRSDTDQHDLQCQKRPIRPTDMGVTLQASQLKSILRQNGRTYSNSAPSTPTYENFPILPSKVKSIKFNLSTIREGDVRREMLAHSISHTDLRTATFHRPRSSSLDLANDVNLSDGDNDDYGFLTYYGSQLSSLSTAMHKAKSPSQGHRIFPKKWRKSKLGSSSSSSSSPGGKTSSSIWKPEVCTFIFCVL